MTVGGLRSLGTISKGPITVVNQYMLSDIDEQPTYTYFGKLASTGAWYIMRMDGSGNARYAKGTTAYATNWTNRLALTYNLWS